MYRDILSLTSQVMSKWPAASIDFVISRDKKKVKGKEKHYIVYRTLYIKTPPRIRHVNTW